MRPFAGEIAVSDDGSFIGILRDQWGTAGIKGRFTKGLLEFNKYYTDLASPDAIGGKSRYTLRAGILIAGGPIVGGWKGIYEVSPCGCEDPPKMQSSDWRR